MSHCVGRMVCGGVRTLVRESPGWVLWTGRDPGDTDIQTMRSGRQDSHARSRSHPQGGRVQGGCLREGTRAAQQVAISGIIYYECFKRGFRYYSGNVRPADQEVTATAKTGCYSVSKGRGRANHATRGHARKHHHRPKAEAAWGKRGQETRRGFWKGAGEAATAG